MKQGILIVKEIIIKPFKKFALKVNLIERMHSWVFGVGSLAFGINLYFKPFIIDSYEEFNLIGSLLEHKSISIFFMFFAVMKLLGLYRNSKSLRLYSLIALIGLWTLASYGFFIRAYQGSNNYGVLFSLMTLLHAYCIAVKGRFE